MAERRHVRFKPPVSRRTIRAKIDMAVMVEAHLDATHAEHAVGIRRGDDGLPLLRIGLVTGRAAYQYAFLGCQIASLGNIRFPIHIFGPIALLAIAERAADDVGTVFVGTFYCLHPPHLFFEGL